MMNYWKTLMIFGIKSTIVWKSLIGSPFIVKDFWKPRFYGDEAIDFHDKEMPKAGSSYICLAVVLKNT